MKQLKLTIFLLLILNTCLHAEIKDYIYAPFQYTYKALWWTASNKYVQKYGSMALFIYGQGICNAKCDGYIWDNLYGDKQTFGINSNNWHAYKNIGRICTFTAFGLKGLAVGQSNMKLKEVIEYTFYESMLIWAIWHKVYYKTRYDNYWDTEHAQRIIYYPNLMNKFRDSYIGMKGNQVYYFDVFRMSIGITGLIKLSFEE